MCRRPAGAVSIAIVIVRVALIGSVFFTSERPRQVTLSYTEIRGSCVNSCMHWHAAVRNDTLPHAVIRRCAAVRSGAYLCAALCTVT